MWPRHNTILFSLICGATVACTFCLPVCAQQLKLTSWETETFAAGLRTIDNDTRTDHVWSRNRPILPNPFASGIQQASFLQTDTPGIPQIDDVQVTPDSSVELVPIAQPDLATRVQELEELVGKLSDPDGSQNDESVTSRLDNLESTLSESDGEDSKFIETLSDDSRRIFNGRIHIDSWQNPKSSPGINAIETGRFTDDPENRLLMRRARIGVRGTVPPDNMSYRLELEFSGQDGGRIRDAWLAWDDLPILNTVRAGNQKRPYGLDHLDSSNFMTFLERPLVVDAVNHQNRRLGLASYGGTPDLAWNWQAGVFNMVPIQDTNDIVGDEPQTEFAGRIANTAWYDELSNGRGYAHFALAGTLAFPDGKEPYNQSQFRTQPEAITESDWLDTGQIDGAESYQLCALETVINVGALQLTGEWMQVWMQRDHGFGSDLSFHGGYVSLSYFLTGEHIPWNRKIGIMGRVRPLENFFSLDTCNGGRGRGWGAWQVAIRFSQADFSDHDIRGGVGESLALALNWY